MGKQSSDKFQCLTTGICIPIKEVCDGWKHCNDGSDESYVACSMVRNPGHNVVVAANNEKSSKGTTFFTIIFFATILSLLMVMVYRCAKGYVN